MTNVISGSGVMGIDPGLDGAVAWILPDQVEVRVTPTIAAGKAGRREFDTTGMFELLTRYPIDLAVIEAVGPMPKQGVTSTFRFGVGYGLWLGLLAALKIPHVAVTPQLWKKVVLAGTAKDKAAAVQFASRRFPHVSLLPSSRSKVPHDGLADALALAEYARRLLDRGDYSRGGTAAGELSDGAMVMATTAPTLTE